MDRQSLQTILSRAETEEMLFGWEDVAEWLEGTLETLLATNLLRPATPASVMDCYDCERECQAAPVTIVKRPNGTRQAYLRCPEYVRVEKPIDRLNRWQVDVDSLAAQLADELAGEAEELMPGRLWMIGRIEADGLKTDVLLARGLGWADGERVFGEARNRKRSRPTLVLVPAHTCSDASSEGSLEIVPLDEVLRFDADGLSVDILVLRRAVSHSTPDVLPDDEAFRASEDYRCVWRNGTQLKPLTPMQAEIVRILDETRIAGSPVMTHASILSKMKSPPTRLSDIFRKSDPRSVLIERVGKDTYRLSI